MQVQLHFWILSNTNNHNRNMDNSKLVNEIVTLYPTGTRQLTIKLIVPDSKTLRSFKCFDKL